MNEVNFVDTPNDILEGFEEKFMDLAEKFKSYGGQAVFSLQMPDDLAQTADIRHGWVGGSATALGLYHLGVQSVHGVMEDSYAAEEGDG